MNAMHASFSAPEPSIRQPFVLNLLAKDHGCHFTGTIESSYSEMLAIFGPARRTFDDANEWPFTGPTGETYIVYDSLPSEQVRGDYVFSIGALTHENGRLFTLWLQEQIGAHRVTKEFKFVA